MDPIEAMKKKMEAQQARRKRLEGEEPAAASRSDPPAPQQALPPTPTAVPPLPAPLPPLPAAPPPVSADEATQAQLELERLKCEQERLRLERAKLEAETAQKKSNSRRGPKGRRRSARPGEAKGPRPATAPKTSRGLTPWKLGVLATVVGLLIGVALFVALKETSPNPQQAKAPPPEGLRSDPPVAPAPPKATAPDVESPANREKSAVAALAVRAANRFQEAKEEGMALEVLDAFVEEHGEVKQVVDARKTLLENCSDLLVAESADIRDLLSKGDVEKASRSFSALRARLPKSLHGKLGLLAIELKGAEAAHGRSDDEGRGKAKKNEGDARLAEFDAPDEDAPPGSEQETDEEGWVVLRPPKEVPDDYREPGLPQQPAATPGPAPRPTGAGGEPVAKRPDGGAKPRGEPTSAGSGADEPEDPAADKESPVAQALAELLHVPHTVSQKGRLHVNYGSQASMPEDFQSRYFDKFEVSSMEGVSVVTRKGLECGAGSQRLARMQHVVAFDGDFDVEVTLWLNFSTSRSVVVFTLGKTYGVSFGQQIVKVSKSGGLKRLSSTLDPSVFRGEREVKVNLTFKDQVLVVRCNGRKTAERKFKPRELSGPFGLLARDVRLQITGLELNGNVDLTKLQ